VIFCLIIFVKQYTNSTIRYILNFPYPLATSKKGGGYVMPHDFSGQTIKGYHIDELYHSSGGMGDIYTATDNNNNKVAIKIPKLNSEDTDKYIDRFKEEIKYHKDIYHTNIVRYIDSGQFVAPGADQNEMPVNVPYMVMEFVEGNDLYDYLKNKDSLEVEEALKVTKQIAEALDVVHQKGIIHRDISTKNIRITEDGQAKLMDFGIAKSVYSHRHLTKTGMVVGNIHFLSPEAVKLAQLTLQSDIYSLGVVLYRMLTGEYPFDGEKEYSILDKIVRGMPLEPIQINSNIPRRVNELVLRMISKDLAIRYAEIMDLRKEIDDILRTLVDGGKTSRKLRIFLATCVALIMFSAFTFTCIWAGRNYSTFSQFYHFRQQAGKIYLYQGKANEKWLIFFPKRCEPGYDINMFVPGKMANLLKSEFKGRQKAEEKLVENLTTLEKGIYYYEKGEFHKAVFYLRLPENVNNPRAKRRADEIISNVKGE